MDNKIENLIRITAKLYYIDGFNQNDIAELIGISRPKVSRLLTRALNEGIVQIKVEDYDPRNRTLEKELKDNFNLNHVLVIKLWGETDIESVRRTIGYFAAPIVAEWIFPNAIIGVSGSRSIFRLIQQIKPPSGTRGITTVQLMGNIDAKVSDFDSIELCRMLASSFGGLYYVLNAPALAPDVNSRQIFLAHKDVKTIWKLYRDMNIAFVGIGSLTQSSFIERGIIGPHDVDKLMKHGAIGEICGRFYDQYGQECASELLDRVIGISLDELREKREVVGVTCGSRRAEAIYAALNSRIIKSLVIDEHGAEAVLTIEKTTQGMLQR
jgi:deoxyribonucleoside regulator